MVWSNPSILSARAELCVAPSWITWISYIAALRAEVKCLRHSWALIGDGCFLLLLLVQVVALALAGLSPGVCAIRVPR